MQGVSCASPRVKVLGPLELEGFGGSVPLRRLKARQLLLLLVIERNRHVSRERLIDALWPGNLPAHPGASLRSYASIAHRAVERMSGVRLTSDHRGYTLRLDDELVDSFCFEQLVRRAYADRASGSDAAALKCLDTALTLVRGRPLDEVAGIRLASGELGRLQSLLLDARERRLEAQLSLGQVHEAVTDARTLVAENPYRERLWELYALGLHRCGDTVAALAAIDHLRRVLCDKFGIDIAPSLSQLEKDLRRGREPLPAPGRAASSPLSGPGLSRGAGPDPGRDDSPPTGRRPGPLFGDILGRDADLRSLQVFLSTSRLITLVGPGGVGKTRLAIEAVRRAESGHVPVWCDLASAGAPSSVEQIMAASLGVTIEPGDRSCQTLAAFIGSKRVLLVLDTCEPAVRAVAGVAEFLVASCPRLVILATSREPLHVPGETLFEVGPLRIPGRDTAATEGPDAAPATDLLALRYREYGGAGDGAHLRERMTQVSMTLEGTPLAIELAARRLAASQSVTWADPEPSATDLAAFDPPSGWEANRPARHQGMRDVVEWSYGLVSSTEQRALEAVASFAGWFTLGQAITITTTTRPPGGLVGDLAGLIDKSLLQVREIAGRSCYRIPDVVRAYLRERLRGSPYGVIGPPTSGPANRQLLGAAFR
jgi:predicted ATPase/DNA-binding SARP family transcriptional activator